MLGGGGLALTIGGLLAAFGRKQLIEVSRNYEQAISLSELQAQALRHSEQQFRSSFDAAGDAMIIFDDAGTILDANPAASRLSGVPAGDVDRTRPGGVLRGGGPGRSVGKNPHLGASAR